MIPPSQSHPHKRIGMVARWQPPHKGHAIVLQGLCQSAEEVLIGIGSSNSVDYRNPFSLEDREQMLNTVLTDFQNYTLIPIPDLHDGPRWRTLLRDTFGALDVFVTANPYVKSLMQSDYTLKHPIEFVPKDVRIAVNGTMVRENMAKNEDWQSLVPPSVSAYISENNLDDLFRKKYGLQTLALKTIIQEGE